MWAHSHLVCFVQQDGCKQVQTHIIHFKQHCGKGSTLLLSNTELPELTFILIDMWQFLNQELEEEMF